MRSEGICSMRVEFTASLVEVISGAPPFESRFHSVFGCFSVDVHDIDQAERASMRRAMVVLPGYVYSNR